MAPWTAVIALLFAFCLDRWFGEPDARLHPVGWMRMYLGSIGSHIAPREAKPGADWRSFWAGALAWYGGAVMVGLIAYLLELGVLMLDEALAGVLLGALLKPMLSWRTLRMEVAGVESALAESLLAGRMQLRRLVNGEVMQLDEAQVREAAIATLAREVNESVVAPVFWFVAAGLPGAVVYRFTHAAASMWGYRGVRAGLHWEWAGRCASWANHILAWLPARITALLFAALAGGLAFGPLRAQALRVRPLNNGWPLAAMAASLGVRLRTVETSTLNESARVPAVADTLRALRMADQAVAVLLAWTCFAVFLIAWERPW